MDDLRYPIGTYNPPDEITPEIASNWIDQIATAPENLRAAVHGLTEAQLDTPYRPGGWTVRQVVHHVGDSHMNSLVRFKWALTEDNPTIKAYNEKRWAELADYREVPVDTSLTFLEALHVRLVTLLRSLGPDELARPFMHPDSGPWTIGKLMGLYAWHGRHHVAHITALKEREGWG